MSEIVLDSGQSRPWGIDLQVSRAQAAECLGVASVVILGAVLRFANLTALGYANHYYSAAVQAMLQSWHNFFFVAAEPGGSVTVDKPPVGLWFQVLSAKIFGVNAVGVLLPEVLVGLISIVVIYYLVRRRYGIGAGLVAGLALALTPVVVATDRNNTMDSTLILTLLLAVWAFIRSAEAGRARYLLLGAALVGVGFNVKMLQAYLPLPAFLTLYFLGSPERLPRKVVNLTAAVALLLVISFSWATIVDLTPADQRPYVGSSGDNSEYSLIFGYNGLGRLEGMRFGRNSNPAALLSSLPQLPQQLLNTLTSQQGRGNGFGGGFGMFGTGQPGPLRLITPPLSKEMSWLLPFGILGLVLLLFARPRWPIAPEHQSFVLWGGWLLIGGVFFSVAGFFHPYYLSMLAPPLAALVGIGVALLWRLRTKFIWLAVPLLIVGAIATLVLQWNTVNAFANTPWWIPLAGAFVLVGAILLALSRIVPQAAIAGLAIVVVALVITPGYWSAQTNLNSSANQSLPAAYDGRSSGPPNRGRSQVDPALLAFLEKNTQGMKYMMAVPSSMQGADYVIATGRGVLYMGGFMGQDRVVTADSLAKLVSEHELRYIYWDARGGNGFGRGNGMQSDVSAWITQSCRPVQGYDTSTQNSGAPDGTSSGVQSRGFGAMQVSLYDCGA